METQTPTLTLTATCPICGGAVLVLMRVYPHSETFTCGRCPFGILTLTVDELGEITAYQDSGRIMIVRGELVVPHAVRTQPPGSP